VGLNQEKRSNTIKCTWGNWGHYDKNTLTKIQTTDKKVKEATNKDLLAGCEREEEQGLLRNA